MILEKHPELINETDEFNTTSLWVHKKSSNPELQDEKSISL